MVSSIKNQNDLFVSRSKSWYRLMPCGFAQIVFQYPSNNLYDFQMNLEDKNTDCLDIDNELHLSSLINSSCSQTRQAKTISTKLQYSSLSTDNHRLHRDHFQTIIWSRMTIWLRSKWDDFGTIECSIFSTFTYRSQWTTLVFVPSTSITVTKSTWRSTTSRILMFLCLCF